MKYYLIESLEKSSPTPRWLKKVGDFHEWGDKQSALKFDDPYEAVNYAKPRSSDIGRYALHIEYSSKVLIAINRYKHKLHDLETELGKIEDGEEDGPMKEDDLLCKISKLAHHIKGLERASEYLEL